MASIDTSELVNLHEECGKQDDLTRLYLFRLLSLVQEEPNKASSHLVYWNPVPPFLLRVCYISGFLKLDIYENKGIDFLALNSRSIYNAYTKNKSIIEATNISIDSCNGNLSKSNLNIDSFTHDKVANYISRYIYKNENIDFFIPMKTTNKTKSKKDIEETEKTTIVRNRLKLSTSNKEYLLKVKPLKLNNIYLSKKLLGILNNHDSKVLLDRFQFSDIHKTHDLNDYKSFNFGLEVRHFPIKDSIRQEDELFELYILLLKFNREQIPNEFAYLIVVFYYSITMLAYERLRYSDSKSDRKDWVDKLTKYLKTIDIGASSDFPLINFVKRNSYANHHINPSFKKEALDGLLVTAENLTSSKLLQSLSWHIFSKLALTKEDRDTNNSIWRRLSFTECVNWAGLLAKQLNEKEQPILVSQLGEPDGLSKLFSPDSAIYFYLETVKEVFTEKNKPRKITSKEKVYNVLMSRLTDLGRKSVGSKEYIIQLPENQAGTLSKPTAEIISKNLESLT